ncbi:hypothetical protein B0O99DRAFT_87401 [Bisporella sp. PMI_857]|nr:hypothetical protein B0O99DRAFT_87401 [Bisporella sp. PMI_857]
MGPSTSDNTGSSSPLSSIPSPTRDIPSPTPKSKPKAKSSGYLPPSRRAANLRLSPSPAVDSIPKSSTITYKPTSFTAISHSLFLSHLSTLQAEIWRLKEEAIDTEVPEADLGNQWTRIWNYAEAALGKLVVCVECDHIHPQSWLTKRCLDVKAAVKEQTDASEKLSNLSVLDDLRSQVRQLENDYIIMSHIAGDDGTGSRD